MIGFPERRSLRVGPRVGLWTGSVDVEGPAAPDGLGELRRFGRWGLWRPFASAPHLLIPRKGWRRPLRLSFGTLFSATLGSLALALVLGIAIGRGAAGGRARPEVLISGAGHLAAGLAEALLGSGGFSTDPKEIRHRLLATGIPETVFVERALFAIPRVEVREKRAVALLSGDPPEALAGDGTVLGPATVADFRWAGARDLPVIRGAGRGGPDFARRTALAARLAAALQTRPELDALVSELLVDAGPLRVGVVLRVPELTILLTESHFLERFEFVAGLLPDLLGSWPGTERIDARIPDRLLLRPAPRPLSPPLRAPLPRALPLGFAPSLEISQGETTS